MFKYFKILFLFLLSTQILKAQDAPSANNDSVSAFINTPLNEVAPGLLSNDIDINGDVLRVTEFAVNGSTFNTGETAVFGQGSIRITADGGYSFVPNSNFVGNVSTINYTITDGTFTSSANLSITVIHPPTAPVANDENTTIFVNTALNEDAPGLLSNDTDINDDVLSVTEFAVNGSTFNTGETAVFGQGSIRIAADGSYSFVPNSNFVGNVSTINYTITDGAFTSSANLSITVIHPPTAPVANDVYDTADENATLSVTAPGVMDNDSDINEDIITVTEFSIEGILYNAGQIVNLPQGDFTLNQDGSYILEPTTNFTGELPTISYTITDGAFTNTANLFISVEPTENLLELRFLSSCNQGFTSDGEYKIRYAAVFRNRSNAKSYHEPSLIRNIDITSDLQAAFGNGCVIRIDDLNVYNNSFTENFQNNGEYPREFNNDALNNDFSNATSSSVFNTNAVDNLILYPRQSLTLVFCVVVDPFCNGRPNPTPSGSGIDFTTAINATSSSGNPSESDTITDFHTTEAIVTAGLYVPEFNDALDPLGTINPDGTYDYHNRVIITNEGSATATNVNFNMGLGSFLDNGIFFNEIRIDQVSGPPVNVNTAYDGDIETNLLLPNNSLESGEKVILELFYEISPYNSESYNYFYQITTSLTQGNLDGFDETTASSKRRYSFNTWSDSLGNHIDRYYRTDSDTNAISSSNQCICTTSSMRFLYTSSSSINNSISDTETSPNGVLEHEELTFQITIENTSESVQLRNLQVQDDLNTLCAGNIISLQSPIIESSTAVSNPVLNSNFNGTTDINLFDGSSGILGANESIIIQFSVVLSEPCADTNTVTFTSGDPLNVLTSTATIDIDISTDSDNDGVINNIDLDDDNDTIPDVLESNGLNPLDDDDADLIPNYRDVDFGDDVNLDGVVDVFDFDNDGVANHLDLDSDNDGVLDIVEAGNSSLDTDSNGGTNTIVGDNGLENTLETDDTSTAIINYTLPNSDSDSNLNYLDIDSDNDGIVDNIEAQTTSDYSTLSNVFSESGIDTSYPNGILPIDTDGDLIFDYIDVNSDNDIRDDVVEAWDTNSDGIAETLISNIDSDNDGLDDAFDTNNSLINPTNNQTPLSFPNVDNVDNPERDWREIIAILVIIENASATEGSDLIFNINLVTKNNNSISIESLTPIIFSFTSSNGTTTTDIYDVANSPFDYSAISNFTFTIPANTVNETFAISSIEDNIFERSELFTLTGSVTSNNTINTETISIGTILDNDNAPSISMNNSRIEEGFGLNHTITLSNPSSIPIEVEIKTSDDLAIQSLDYQTVSDVFTISGTIDPNNVNTEILFSIPTFLDNLNELDEETLNVTGTVLSTGNTGLEDLQKTATIIDVDPNPLISISNETVEEGGGLVFVVQLLNANNELMQNYLPISFLLETTDISTSGNLDYNAISMTTEIPALTSSISQSITTINDRLNESIETFNLRAMVNLLITSNTSIPFGIGTITDDDYPNLFSPNSDGKSDTFKISGIVEDYPNFKIEIFNRQGNKVYSHSNNGRLNPIWWDGSFNGKPSPVGVYYYTLEYNDGVKKPKTSFIQLIR